MSISLIQKNLKDCDCDGWLFYDYHGINPYMAGILGYDPNAHITRRVFYYIPRDPKEETFSLVSKVEPNVLDMLDGKKYGYLSEKELLEKLGRLSGKRVAMEYSRVPALSYLDAGTAEMLNDLKIEVVSSGDLIQKLTSVLDEDQISSHMKAAEVTEEITAEVCDFLRGGFNKNEKVFERDVIEFILGRIKANKMVTEHEPIVAADKNTANPHYSAKGRGDLIAPNSLLMVDFWCKEKGDRAVFADVTKMMIGRDPTPEMLRVFDVVRKAQAEAFAFIQREKHPRGCDVDALAQRIIDEAGYGKYICHRLGHNITSTLHGPGANLDSFEACDERRLLVNTICSNEPGIYIENKFGIRLEHDVVIRGTEVLATGGVQEELIVL